MITADIGTDIFQATARNFDQLVFELFSRQYQHVPVYRNYCLALQRTPDRVRSISEIPFLPVEFFKTHDVVSDGLEPELIFESSTTTGTIPSRHLVANVGLYQQSLQAGFRHFFGNETQYCILALLPSYLERGNSSLVFMADRLMKASGHPMNDFFLENFDELHAVLLKLERQQQPTLLLGVTYALLDFAERYPMPLKVTRIIETGGMKGRRREMIREEVHALLQNAFSIEKVFSEYGMTEMLSQAYSLGNGVFSCPPWMRVSACDVNDPFEPVNGTGRLRVIDLANVLSCSFLLTSDLGTVYRDGTFEVLGRLQGSDIRGCNLMYSS